MDRARSLAPSLTLVALTCLAYANSLHGEFVFDDLLHVVNNPLIRDLSLLADPDRALASGAEPLHLQALRSRPVAYLTFAVNYRLHGLEVFGYHAANLVIHLLAGLLFFRLIRTTLGLATFERSRLRSARTGVALFAGACFLLHPIQTQAVSYVVQRMASLAAMLCLLALVCYVESRLAVRVWHRWGLYGVSIAALVAAMATKENAATFPLVLLLYEALFLSGEWRRRLLGLAPHLASLAIVPLRYVMSPMGGSTLSPAAALDAARGIEPLGRLDYLYTEMPVIVGYLRLIVWPAGQNLDHDPAIHRSPANMSVILSFALLLILGLAAVWAVSRRTHEPAWRLGGFGGLWFFLSLAVESTVVPITDVMAEHRLYLPLAGLLLALAATVSTLVASWPRKVVYLAAASCLIALTLTTVARNRVWRTPAALWTDSLGKSPGKSRPLNNVGIVHELDGKLDEAIGFYRRAIAADPRNFEARFNLGNALAKRGQLEDSAHALVAALELVPTSARARDRLLDVLTLAATRMPRGDPDSSTVPEAATAGSLRTAKQAASAILDAEARLTRNPRDTASWSLLGELYLAAGWSRPASRCLMVALRQRPDDAKTYRLLGEALARQGRSQEAAEMFRQGESLERTQASVSTP